MQRKNKPKFNVPNLGFFKSVKARWRKPRGTHNKKRMKYYFMGALPKIGYRNPVALRGNHPSGQKEVLVSSPAQMDGLKDVVLRVASSVGGKKRALMVEKAKALHLRIVNFGGAAWKKTGQIKAQKPLNEPKHEGSRVHEHKAHEVQRPQQRPAQKTGHGAK